MNLQYIIDNLIKPDRETKDTWIDFSIFKDDLNILYSDLDLVDWEKNTDLRTYNIASHICTDSEVGISAYFLKDELVCISKQSFRKSSEDIVGWVSEALATKTKEYIISLIPEDNKGVNIDILDMKQDMGEGYNVEYTGQMISKYVIYEDQFCLVTEDNSKGYTNFHNIKVMLEGNEIEIDIRDCTTPYRITENKNLF